MADKRFACKAAEVEAGAAKLVQIDKLPIGLFRLDDGFYGLLNVCPHRGAALCEGPVCGTTQTVGPNERAFIYERENAIVRCAWHGWEFDIKSGRFLVDESLKVRRFDVSQEGEDLYVHI